MSGDFCLNLLDVFLDFDWLATKPGEKIEEVHKYLETEVLMWKRAKAKTKIDSALTADVKNTVRVWFAI